MLRLKNRKLNRQKPIDRVEIGYEKSASGFHADCENATGCAIKSLDFEGARYNFIASYPVTDTASEFYGKYATTVAVGSKNCIKQYSEKTLEIPDGNSKNHGVIIFDKWRSISVNRYYFISFDYEITPYEDGSIPPVYMAFAFGRSSAPTDYEIQYRIYTLINKNNESSGSFSVILIYSSSTEYYSGVPILKFMFNSNSNSAMVGNGKITVRNVIWSDVQGWNDQEHADDFIDEREVLKFYTDQPLGACADAQDEVKIEASTGKIKIWKRTAYANRTVYAIDTPHELTLPYDTPIMLCEGEPNRVYLKSPSPPLKMTVKYFSKER
ncbi:MAG: hypothetical protein IKA74_01040 [Clostridia bacterium]|nr:hypothetical protein [Clostridia bacterium]